MDTRKFPPSRGQTTPLGADSGDEPTAIRPIPKSWAPKPPETPYITEEEFGVNLYETIKTVSGIKALDQHRANAIHRNEGFKVQELLTRRKALQLELVSQLKALTDDEMDQILARYPFVTGY